MCGAKGGIILKIHSVPVCPVTLLIQNRIWLVKCTNSLSLFIVSMSLSHTYWHNRTNTMPKCAQSCHVSKMEHVVITSPHQALCSTSLHRPEVRSHSGEKWLHLRAALSSSLVTCTHSPNSFTETSHHLPSTPQRQTEWRGDTCYKRHSYGSVDIYWPIEGLQFIFNTCLSRYFVIPLAPVHCSDTCNTKLG